MATNIITAENSYRKPLTDFDGSAILIVEQGGYITVKTNETSYRAFGENGDISISGSVISKINTAVYLQRGFSSTDSGHNSVLISDTGMIKGRTAIAIEDDLNHVENNGIIESNRIDGIGVYLSGSYNDIQNHGVISGKFGIYGDQGVLTVNNSGTIQSSDQGIYIFGTAFVENSGTLVGDITIFNGLTLENSGLINGSVHAVVDSSNGIELDDTGIHVVNSGTITALVSEGLDTDDVSNSGFIRTISLGNGDDTLDNRAGGVIARTVRLDGDSADITDNDTLINAGIMHARVYTGAGDDVVRTDNGSIVGLVTLGDGLDTYSGGSERDWVTGGSGADRIAGRAGSDRLTGDAGADTISGGAGADFLSGGSVGGANESDTFIFFDGDTGVAPGSRDIITDFTDHGSLVTPFAPGADLMDLHSMDASAVAAGNQAFSFNAVSGAAFSGRAGSLIWFQTGEFALVLGDTDGDRKADFVIQLNGVHALLASDFVL